MALKITRVEPGVYSADLHGEEHRVVLTTAARESGWYAENAEGKVVAKGKSKKEVISRLEILARQPQDRTVSDTLKMFRRSEIKKGTKLTVEGISGKCFFDAYTRKDDGTEWIDITVCRTLARRVVRPERIKTVHRK